MTVRVTLYRAEGCHLCDDAIATARATCLAEGAELVEIDITGVAALEERYRPELPVIEVDGARAFKFYVDADALAERIRRHAARDGSWSAGHEPGTKS